MSEIVIRRAEQSDKLQLSRAIAFAFEEDFNDLTSDMEKIASAIRNGINTGRFFVAVEDNEILGMAACADKFGRAVSVIPSELKKHLGFFKGSFAAKQYYIDFGAPLDCDEDTGFIEFVGVARLARRKHIATKLIEHIILVGEYRKYMLDVLQENKVAQECYKKIGFVETGIHRAKHPKLDGFTAKIIMEFKKDSE